jgi:hypothetical protein
MAVSPSAIAIPKPAQVVTASGTVELGARARLPPHDPLPGLEPQVDDLFQQLD